MTAEEYIKNLRKTADEAEPGPAKDACTETADLCELLFNSFHGRTLAAAWFTLPMLADITEAIIYQFAASTDETATPSDEEVRYLLGLKKSMGNTIRIVNGLIPKQGAMTKAEIDAVYEATQNEKADA